MITRQTELPRRWCTALKGSPERAKWSWKRFLESRFCLPLRSCRGWAGEKGQALAVAHNAPPVPVTRDIVQEITSLNLVNPDTAIPSTAQVSHKFTAEVMEFIPTTLERMPRLGEPGPLGMRAEHWYDFGTQAVRHQPVLAGHRPHRHGDSPGRCPPIPTRWSGHATRQTHKRTPTASHDVLPASTRAQSDLRGQEAVLAAAGPLQHCVGCQDGANKMIKSIQYFAEAERSRVLVALDLKAAFQNVS